MRKSGTYLLGLTLLFFFLTQPPHVRAAAGPSYYFTWSAITSTQHASVPFPVSIAAYDDQAQPITNFDGVVALSAHSNFGTATRFFDDFEDGDFAGWNLIGAPPGNFVSIVTNASPSNQYSLRVGPVGGFGPYLTRGFSNSYPSHFSFSARAEQTNRIAGYVALTYGGGYMPVQFYFGNNGVMGLGSRWNFAQGPAGIPYESNRWYDVRIDFIYEMYQTRMNLSVDGSLAATNIPLFDSTYSGVNTLLVNAYCDGYAAVDNFKLWLDHVPITLPLNPANVNFTNGTWSGEMTVGTVGTNVLLRADDGAQHVGDSSQFFVFEPPRLAVNAPAEATEGDGTLNGAIALDFPLVRDLAIALASGDETKLTVSPGNLVIPANATNVPFTIQIADGPALDGSQTVNITATPQFLAPAAAPVIVHDNETAVLGLDLTLPVFAHEGDGDVFNAGRVSLSAVPPRDIPVRLTSSNTNELIVPATVLIPAGQTSALFNLFLPNDTVIDGTQQVAVVAHVQNWTDATANIAVRDDESTTLLVSLSFQLSEGDGLSALTGTINISGTLSSNLVVSLASSDESELLVQSSVTILAGSTFANFSLTALDDAIADGRQRVTVTASAGGFSSGSNSVWVLDDEVDHFVFDGITPPVKNATVFFPRVRARDIVDAPITHIGGPVRLSAVSSNGIPVQVTPTNIFFNNGESFPAVTVLSAPGLVRLVATDTNGHTGQSDWFFVNEVPLQIINSTHIADLAYDPNSHSILVSGSNGLRRIDVASGSLGPLMPVPGGVKKIAVSTGGQFLYGALNSTSAVRRFTLPGFATDADILLQSIGAGPKVGLLDLAASPSNPLVIAVAQSNVIGGFSSVNEGVRIYDGTSARPLVSTNGANAVAFGPASRLYDWNPQTGFASSRLVTDNGLSNILIQSAFQDYGGGTLIQYANGKVFPPSVRALDADSLAILGILPYAVPFVADPNGHRLVSAWPNVAKNVRLVISDQVNLVPVAFLDVTNVSLGSDRILRCGSNTIAFSTTNQQVVIVRSPLFHPSAPTDLSVRARTVPSIVTTNDDIFHVVTVSNAGPNAADVMINTPATLFSILRLPSYVSSRTIRVGLLSPGQSTNLIYTSPTNAPGVVKEWFAVGSSAAELNYADNVVTQTVSVIAAPATATNVFAVTASSYDIVWNPDTARLYASSVPSFQDDRLRVIDPFSRTVTAEIPVGALLRTLRLTPDRRRLHVVAENGYKFAPVDLVAQTSAPPRTAYGSAIYDFAGLPQDSNAVLVASSAGVELYVSDVRQSTIGSFVKSLTVLTNDNSIWGYDYNLLQINGAWVERPELKRFSVGTDGVSTVSVASTVPLYGRLHSFDGKLFDDYSGAVLDPVSNQLFSRFSGSGLFLPDPATRRVFRVRWTGNGFSIAALDLYTHEMLGAFSVPGPMTFSGIPTLWGDDGIAISAGQKVLLVRTTLRNDADGDSLPDAWETQHFGGIAANPNADDDGDGASNIAEYYAGTNPSSAASVLRVVANQAGSDTLSFTAGPQRLYAIECSITLPATNWFVVTNGVTGNGPTSSVTLLPPANNTRFYRVRISPPLP